MPLPLFDSRLACCKEPFGAVPAGDRVRFAIHLPKRFQNCSPMLRVCGIDRWGDPVYLPMELCGGDRATNTYQCFFTPEKPELLIYCFELRDLPGTGIIRRGSGGEGVLGDGGLWQLTVYDPEMRCPPALREGVMYQIFPDRFRNSGAPKEGVSSGRTLRSDWGGLPYWRPDESGEVTNSDYFGGDLAGITEKLDYLSSLGVTVIYLNPIYEAHSNHRYNVADFKKVDPLLGSGDDFRTLCQEAGDRGISILIDGVFSHTGSDSLYFNKEKRYGEGGAYNDPDSPYRTWYQFTNYPTGYECWWGILTLPNVNETDPSYLDFICGEEGVARHWLALGAKGFRLDVTDELPDEFLDRFHESVKGFGGDCAILGEVWEDASHKISYGSRRRYLLGGQLDGVMNYPFKDAILGYVRYGNGEAFYNTIMQILENYPRPAIQSLMNFLSTHDVARAITMLGGEPLEGRDREWQEARHFLGREEYERGCCLFRLASVLQFGLPGIPCVYYGDEAGLMGYGDPFNRICYPWDGENRELVEHIRGLGAVRRDYPFFAEADFIPLHFSDSLCSFVRSHGSTQLLFAVNRTDQWRKLELPWDPEESGLLSLTGEYQQGELGPRSGVVLHREGGAEPWTGVGF